MPASAGMTNCDTASSGRGVRVGGQRSPRVMFSEQGEKQFAPHATKAVEHFAEILLHLMG